MNENEIRQLVRDELESERREVPNVREIIREELENFISSDRYTFQKDAQFFDGRKIIAGGDKGLRIGSATDQKIGFYGVTPVDQGDAVSNPSINNVSGSGDDSTINGNFSEVEIHFQRLRDRLKDVGIISS